MPSFYENLKSFLRFIEPKRNKNEFSRVVLVAQKPAEYINPLNPKLI
jgi:preprotein translocase subunit Sss1